MNDEEKARRRAIIRRDIIGAVLIVIVLYFLVAVVLSLIVGQFVHTSVENNGFDNPYPDRISDGDFQELSCDRYSFWKHYKGADDGKKLREFTVRSPIFTLVGLGGGRSYFYFDYNPVEYTDNILTDGKSVGGTRYVIGVWFEFQNGKLVITDVNSSGYA